ncbi:MAG TPA: hypothetical protein VFC10_17350 [Terriglobia bacterium]|jgi:hypothetical protein|nr:hypothetical protein [Terriglobia bacterium]
MSFTTVDAVAAHYPGFQRGVTNQNPSDAQIQTWIDNQAARITAVAAARGFDLTDLETTNPQAYTVLALINENGAAADLGDALFSLLGPGTSAQGWANPNTLRKSFENMITELSQGTYDKLFVSAARTEDVYPAFSGIAGQETDPADPETDSNLLFRKSDVY